ncbi:tetratricopeptide repeat protein [Arsukibacterium indicum]|uniref:Sel1 repeat family protein n=1 Tax=Arsukibacterium indicum TaxID=2848612 RepID=A0ABS6MI71_9GAMM|nr:tetratricopeptide repeat protein [Arsukibacterium indicum]MBV2128511.1 sel1 repeat family protein [Arsukibacterium indicum]
MIKIIPLLLMAGLISILPQSEVHAQSNAPDNDSMTCGNDKCNDEIRTLHRMARFGSFEAMTLLSMVYAKGDGREADPQRALSYLERAVSYRHPMAVYLLSDWYQVGFVVAQDTQRAEALLDDAVKLNHAPAQYKKALQLLQQPDNASRSEGFLLLEKASKQRLVDAMFLLARLKHQGTFTEADLESAAELYKKLVLSGHEESRPFLRQAIHTLAAKPEAAELVADLQESYDIEIIQVIGQEFKGDAVLYNVVSQLRHKGLYSWGGMSKNMTESCDGSNGCFIVTPKSGDSDLNQALSGRR